MSVDEGRLPDPRGVRVSAPLDDPLSGGQAVVVEPSTDPLVGALVDGQPVHAVLRRLDPIRAVLVEGQPGEKEEGDGRHTPVVRLDPDRTTGATPGTRRTEILVDGWRVLVELESEHRAALRERAQRGAVEAAHGGPTEVRAIIPGRILSVSVAVGDAVVAGQQLLVVEAMKMQNELRAPRDGTIERVAVGQGATIEVGDLLLVLG